MPVVPALIVSGEDRVSLGGIASLRDRAVREAKLLLTAAEGLNSEESGHRVGVSASTLRAWRAAAAYAGSGLRFVGIVGRPVVGRRTCPSGGRRRWTR